MELFYFIVVMLASSVLQGITGFGGSLIAAPLLLLLVDKTVSVVSLTFVSVAVNLVLIVSIKKNIDKKTFYDLFIPSLVGLPIGLMLLKGLDAVSLRMIVASLSMVFAILLLTKSLKYENTKIKRIFAGWFSGVLRTSVGLNSPPVVLLLAADNTDKDEMRKTLSFLFLMMSLVSIALFYFTGQITGKVWTYGLWSMPIAWVGGIIGNQISKRVSQKVFIWSVFVLISASIIVSVLSGLHHYLK